MGHNVHVWGDVRRRTRSQGVRAGAVEWKWDQDGKMGTTIEEPLRVRKTDTFIVLYLLVFLFGHVSKNLSLCCLFVLFYKHLFLPFYFNIARDVVTVFLYLLMMIAFIILNSSLVPWIENLCSSTLYIFEFSVLRWYVALSSNTSRRMCIYRHTNANTHVWSAHRRNGENQAQVPSWKGQGNDFG